MLTVKTKVKDTGKYGKGLFIGEVVKKGKILGLLTDGCAIMTEEEYQQEQTDGNKIVIMTAVRWVGKYFLYGDKITKEEYINHSESPTMLYHCGICFATRDLNPGDELTVDYKYFLAKNDVLRFKDFNTGGGVDGLTSRDALLASTKELLDLLTTESIEVI